MRSRSTRFRIAVAGLAALLAVGWGPLSGGSAQAQVDTGAFCANAPDSDPFTDVADNDQNIANIRCLVASEITVGVTPTTYEPASPVTRRQMALFIKRLIDTANELEIDDLAALPADDGTSEFPDIADESPASQGAIRQLEDAGVIDGKVDGTYGPGDLVTRDQMAKFINNALEFLLGAPLPEGPDAFTDDSGVFEVFINKLARAEIVVGLTATTYGPRQSVTRRQMASFLIRGLAVLEQLNAITPLDPDEAPGNEQLTITPTEEVTLTAVPGTPEMPTDATDDRVYTVSGLDDALTYRVTLVDADNISRDAEDDAVFVEDAMTGLADAGAVNARITVVNGAPVTAAQSVGAIAPQSGTITFTVDGEDFESVTPVVYTDQGGANTRLNLDDDGKPTEPFGIGGTINYVPAEAPGGAFLPLPVDGVDKDDDLFVAGGATYEYDANDTFTVDGVPSTLAGFEMELSVGDTVGGTYAPDPAAVSTFNLIDITPLAPTAVTVDDVTDTTATLTVTGVAPGATVRIFRAADPPGTFATATQVAETSTDADPDTAGFQVELTGLTADTDYKVFATQVLDGEESDPTAGTDLDTTVAPATLTITAATVNEINDGVNGPALGRSQIVTTFSANVDCDAAFAAGDATVTGPGPDNEALTCTDGPGANQVTFTLTTPLNDVNPDVSYTLEVDAGAVVTNPGGVPVQANSTTFNF